MSASPEEFVRTWQRAESLQDVAQALGMDSSSAYSRAAHYRKKGVRLKKFTKRSKGGRLPLDVAALNALAKSLNGKGD